MLVSQVTLITLSPKSTHPLTYDFNREFNWDHFVLRSYETVCCEYNLHSMRVPERGGIETVSLHTTFMERLLRLR